MQLKTICKRLLQRSCISATVMVVIVSFIITTTYGQGLTMRQIAHSEKKVSISTLFNDISAQSSYVILYEDEVGEMLKQKVNVNHGTSLQDVLQAIAKQSNLEIKVINKNIVVRVSQPDKTLPESQDFQVNGRIVGEDGTPLIGATVLLKGTEQGTVTDQEGEFRLEVPDEEAVLVFSYVGYERREVTVGNQTNFEITLQRSMGQLEDVVITGMGVKRERKSLGYSVGSVGGEELTEVPRENMITSLAGRVSGVTINATGGDPGSSVSMIIRGQTSLQGDNQPLFVIDGVPVDNSFDNNTDQMGSRNVVDYGNPISDLNVNDIDSISVLKGPSAAALYGNRAANGVVWIKTKEGSSRQGMGISVNSQVTFDQPFRYLDLHSDFAAGTRPVTLDEGSNYWGGYPLDKGHEAVQWNSPTDENGNPIATELVSHPNNAQNFVQTGITTNNNISMNGGNDQATYRISYTNMTNRGIVPGADNHRNSLNLSSSYEVVDNVTLSTKVNVGRTHSNNRPAGNRGANPLQAMYSTAPHVDITELQDYWVDGQEGIQQRQVGNHDNPYFLAHGVKNSFYRDRVWGNLQAQWQITPDLNLRARYMLDNYHENRETQIPMSYSREPNGAYHTRNLNNRERNTDLMLTYNTTSENWDFSVTAGGNYRKDYDNNNYAGGSNLELPNLYTTSNISPLNLGYSRWLANKGIYSVFGSASLGYRSMVYLDVTGRNDWSSTLPEENRSYFYPSASLSFLMGTILQMPDYVTLAKIRGGIAQVGNDTGPYRLQPTLNNAGNWGNATRLSVPSGLLTSDLKPEIATNWEIGTDIGLFQNRINLDVTYYVNDNRNQILNLPLPNSSGYSSKQVNAGLVSSKGWDISLNGTPLQEDNFRWNVGVNFTRNRTQILELAEGIDYFNFWTDAKGGAYTWEGGTIGNLYDREIVTVEDESSPYHGWPLLDANSAYWQDRSDIDNLEKVGNFNHDFLVGIQNRISVGKFTLSANIDWRQGGDFVSQTYRYGESDWKSQRQRDILIPKEEASPEMLKSNPEKYIIPRNGHFPRVGGMSAETGGYEVTQEGITAGDGLFIPGVYQNEEGEYVENLGGPGTIYRVATASFPWSFMRNSMFDASFVKLRSLSLSYQLDRAVAQNIGVRNASVSVFTRNVILWTKAKNGIDPEHAFQPENGSFKQGIERYNVTPWLMPIGVGLSVDL